MIKVKIYGAGSIGNHLAHASRRLGWDVHMCDIDQEALDRAKREIYPGRYGQWDEAIQLFPLKNVPTGDYDYIFIGTPPHTHGELAWQALKESPKAILVEKPLCAPSPKDVGRFVDILRKSRTKIFVGYNHVVSRSINKVDELISEGDVGPIETLDVEFREHWGGIFAAHPWLKGPHDSYLGFCEKGGGASGEHSHALNLWQHLSRQWGAGRVTDVSAMMDFPQHDRSYDKLFALHLKTESGLVGRVVQDVVTKPPRKWARIQGHHGSIECFINDNKNNDRVVYRIGEKTQEFVFEKTRPDDFIVELQHVDDVVSGKRSSSPIDLKTGLETMNVLLAAHQSVREGKTVKVDTLKESKIESMDSKIAVKI